MSLKSWLTSTSYLTLQCDLYTQCALLATGSKCKLHQWLTNLYLFFPSFVFDFILLQYYCVIPQHKKVILNKMYFYSDGSLDMNGWRMFVKNREVLETLRKFGGSGGYNIHLIFHIYDEEVTIGLWGQECVLKWIFNLWTKNVYFYFLLQRKLTLL